jgi:hypothetical protein
MPPRFFYKQIQIITQVCLNPNLHEMELLEAQFSLNKSITIYTRGRRTAVQKLADFTESYVMIYTTLRRFTEACLRGAPCNRRMSLIQDGQSKCQ